MKYAVTVLAITCVGLLLGGGYAGWSYGRLQLQAAFAEEQTRVFEEMRAQAVSSDAPSEITGCLEYVVSYYPSGSKQRTGSQIDAIVERYRAAVIRDIREHLHRVTDEASSVPAESARN